VIIRQCFVCMILVCLLVSHVWSPISGFFVLLFRMEILGLVYFTQQKRWNTTFVISLLTSDSVSMTSEKLSELNGLQVLNGC